MNTATHRFSPGLHVFATLLMVLLVASAMLGQTNSTGVLKARDGYVVVPNAGPLNLAPRVTIEAWVRLERPAESYGAIVDKDYTTGFSLGVQSIGGRTDSVDLAFAFADNWLFGPRVAVDSLTWMHLALTADTLGHRYALYLNGAEVKAAVSAGVRFADNTANLHIGKSHFGDRFSGMCDEIRIWNVIRSAGEIAALMRHEAKGNEPGLVAVYHFEDVRDTVAWNRATAGGLHGTLSANHLIGLEERLDAFIDDHEPNGKFASATPVHYESMIQQATIAPADTDYYKLWTWPGEVFRIESKAKNAGDTGDMVISIYGGDSVTHITSYVGGYPSFYSAASVPGYRYIQVVNKSGAGGSYTLRAYYRGETFVPDEYEPNNTLAQAAPRPWGETGYGTIFPGVDAGVAAPDVDYYAYTAQANEIGFFIYSLQGVGCGSGYISLHSASAELVNTYPSHYRNYRSSTAGTYYVRIRPNEATYRYYWGGFKGLADIHGMLFDPATVGRGAQISSGMSSAYSYAYVLKITGDNFAGKPDYARTELDGRQFVFGPETVRGLSVTRKFFVPTAAQGDTLGFMRIQDILTNPTGAPVTVNVAVLSDLGANPSRVIASSSGDTLFTLADTWLWTDDKYPSTYAPNLLHIFDGAGGADRVDSVLVVEDDLYWEWRGVTLQPGETKIYLYYVSQDSFPQSAQKKGAAFSGSVLPAAAKLGLGADARLVANWPTNALVSVDEKAQVVTTYALEQNYPNPFNGTTVVSYQLPVASDVKLIVYDILGRQVVQLTDEKKEPGHYEIRFDASGLSSGVYFYRLAARPLAGGQGESYLATRKLLLLR